MKDEEEIDRFDLRSHDIADDKQAELLRLFPEIRTEGGKIDFERLKIMLGESLKIDGQQRRFLADVSFAVIGCVGFEYFRRDDVLPTMIFKFRCHFGLLIILGKSRTSKR